MKLALLSDIHSNIQAFDACLAHANEHGAEQFALLGDFVGYGGDPVAVVQRVQEMANEGAIVIKGNHDELAVAPPAQAQTIGESSAAWTHAQLSDSQRQFLDRLPLTVQQGSILLVHASADRPAQWHYVRDERAASASLDAAGAWPDVRYVFGGHVHRQSLYYRGAGADLMKFTPTAGIAVPVPKHRHWLATIGSVGQPRDHNPQAMYAIFDTDKLQLTFQRVSYDHQTAAATIRRAGLPALFSERLEAGR